MKDRPMFFTHIREAWAVLKGTAKVQATAHEPDPARAQALLQSWIAEDTAVPVAARYFNNCHAEVDLDDAVLRAFGADPDDLPTWVCSHLVYDDYDSSFELWGCRDGWLPTQAQIDAALALGFARCWLVWGGTQERYCTEGKMGDLRPTSHERSSEYKWRVAKLRRQLDQLKGYAKHKFACGVTRTFTRASHLEERDGEIETVDDTVQTNSGICTCGLATVLGDTDV